MRRIGTVELPKNAQIGRAAIEASECRCPDEETTQAMKALIDNARADGESLVASSSSLPTASSPVLAVTPPVPIASPHAWVRRRFPSPPSKASSLAWASRRRVALGSLVHDSIYYDEACGFTRSGNNAGGLEGGMTNGEPLVMTCAMKPIPTMMQPLDTVDTDTLMPVKASKERSDVCAVPAAAVVAEAEVAFVLADAYLEKFGADVIDDIIAARDAYRERIAL